MISRWFRYSAALFCAGLAWAGVGGFAHATDPEMTFDGVVTAGSVEAGTLRASVDAAVANVSPIVGTLNHVPYSEWPEQYCWWTPAVAAYTLDGGVGLAHYAMAGDILYPRVFTQVNWPDPQYHAVGAASLNIRGYRPLGEEPDDPVRIVLDGWGQTQFHGGPVIIGARRYQLLYPEQPPGKDNPWLLTLARSGYLNVYADDGNHDAVLEPEVLKFETDNGVGTVRADHFGSGDSSLQLQAGDAESAQVIIKRTGSVGKVGVGTTSPNAQLDVNGVLQLRDATAPTSAPGSGGYLYADEGVLYAYDSSGNDTIISPHSDPRSVDALAQSSFSDPAVALPFSFDHKNHLVGKGEIVDVAKMVAYIEKMMQAELGAEAGRLKFTYDLPENEKTTLAQVDADRVRQQAEAVVSAAEAMPWIPVGLGADGGFPREAIEQVPETAPRQQMVTIREQVVDFESAKIVTVERQEMQEVPVPTGRMTKQFKKDWRFEGGVLYRRPTVEDVNVEDFVTPFEWPQWIVDRVPGGQQISRSASQLIGQIKAMLAQLARKGSSQVADAKPGR